MATNPSSQSTMMVVMSMHSHLIGYMDRTSAKAHLKTENFLNMD